MFGLDEKIASLASGKPLVALAVALLLGLRHRWTRSSSATVGGWPEPQKSARGALIQFHLGPRFAPRPSSFSDTPGAVGCGHAREPPADYRGPDHRRCDGVTGLPPLLRHNRGDQHAHPHRPPRSLREAYAVGVVHGAGGSAGIGLLLIAAIPSESVALASLFVFAISTTFAMSGVAAGLRGMLQHLPARPVGAFVCAFGAWYLAAAAVGAPYPF